MAPPHPSPPAPPRTPRRAPCRCRSSPAHPRRRAGPVDGAGRHVREGDHLEAVAVVRGPCRTMARGRVEPRPGNTTRPGRTPGWYSTPTRTPSFTLVVSCAAARVKVSGMASARARRCGGEAVGSSGEGLEVEAHGQDVGVPAVGQRAIVRRDLDYSDRFEVVTLADEPGGPSRPGRRRGWAE